MIFHFCLYGQKTKNERTNNMNEKTNEINDTYNYLAEDERRKMF